MNYDNNLPALSGNPFHRNSTRPHAIRKSWHQLCWLAIVVFGTVALANFLRLAGSVGGNLPNLIRWLACQWAVSAAWSARYTPPLWWALYFTDAMEAEP